MEKDFNKEKAKKSFENITGLPVTSDKSNGKERVFTSTVYSDKPLWGSKESSKKISSDFKSEREKRDEELKRKKELEEINKERDKRRKNWKTYTHSERWDEGDIGVEVETTATGDFELEQPESSSAEITELTEEEAGKLESEGVEVTKTSGKKKENEKKHLSNYSENPHKHQDKWGKKSPYVVGGLSFLGLIAVVIAVAKG